MHGSGVRKWALMGLVAVIGLGGCASDRGYGYGGMSVGYGSGGYYGDPYYGSGYYGSRYGWWGDYYYPGSGYYVYDRRGQRHRWNNEQRRYWGQRRPDGRRDRYEGRPGRPRDERAWQGTPRPRAEAGQDDRRGASRDGDRRRPEARSERRGGERSSPRSRNPRDR